MLTVRIKVKQRPDLRRLNKIFNIYRRSKLLFFKVRFCLHSLLFFVYIVLLQLSCFKMLTKNTRYTCIFMFLFTPNYHLYLLFGNTSASYKSTQTLYFSIKHFCYPKFLLGPIPLIVSLLVLLILKGKYIILYFVVLQSKQRNEYFINN